VAGVLSVSCASGSSVILRDYRTERLVFFFCSCREIRGVRKVSDRGSCSCKDLSLRQQELRGLVWFGSIGRKLSPHKTAASADCCSIPKIIIIFSNSNSVLKPSPNLLLTSQDPAMSVLSTNARVSSVQPAKCDNYNLNLHICGAFPPLPLGPATKGPGKVRIRSTSFLFLYIHVCHVFSYDSLVKVTTISPSAGPPGSDSRELYMKLSLLLAYLLGICQFPFLPYHLISQSSTRHISGTCISPIVYRYLMHGTKSPLIYPDLRIDSSA